MPSRAQEAHEKRIAQSVIESLDDKKLLESRDFLKKLWSIEVTKSFIQLILMV